MKELTFAEKAIVEIMRDERPHESVKISKDIGGRMDTYIVLRSQKIIISPQGITYVKE
jgi:hypothetical protein